MNADWEIFIILIIGVLIGIGLVYLVQTMPINNCESNKTLNAFPTTLYTNNVTSQTPKLISSNEEVKILRTNENTLLNKTIEKPKSRIIICGTTENKCYDVVTGEKLNMTEIRLTRYD